MIAIQTLQNPECRQKDWIPPYQVRGRLAHAQHDSNVKRLMTKNRKYLF
jgi:hypothetical protein